MLDGSKPYRSTICYYWIKIKPEKKRVAQFITNEESFQIKESTNLVLQQLSIWLTRSSVISDFAVPDNSSKGWEWPVHSLMLFQFSYLIFGSIPFILVKQKTWKFWEHHFNIAFFLLWSHITVFRPQPKWMTIPNSHGTLLWNDCYYLFLIVSYLCYSDFDLFFLMLFFTVSLSSFFLARCLPLDESFRLTK